MNFSGDEFYILAVKDQRGNKFTIKGTSGATCQRGME